MNNYYIRLFKYTPIFSITISLIANYFCFDHFIQGIPDLPAEPQEHGEQQQQQEEGGGGDEAPASGGLLTIIIIVISSFSCIIN